MSAPSDRDNLPAVAVQALTASLPVEVHARVHDGPKVRYAYGLHPDGGAPYEVYSCAGGRFFELVTEGKPPRRVHLFDIIDALLYAGEGEGESGPIGE